MIGNRPGLALNAEPAVIINEGAVDFSAEDLVRLLTQHNPHDLPAIKKGCIARIPGRPDLVLRYKRTISYLNGSDRTNSAVLASHFNRYERHLNRLEGLGLLVAKHSIFATLEERETPSMTYTVVEHVGRPPSNLRDHLGHLTTTQRHDIGMRTATALHDYFSKPDLTDPTIPGGEIIWDSVESERQYAVDGKLCDYDAYLEQRRWERSSALKSVANWVNDLPSSNEQRALYDNLRASQTLWESTYSAQNTNN